MVHYTGYEAVKDLSGLARQLNMMVRKAGHSSLKTVLTKYSHKWVPWLILLWYLHTYNNAFDAASIYTTFDVI